MTKKRMMLIICTLAIMLIFAACSEADKVNAKSVLRPINSNVSAD